RAEGIAGALDDQRPRLERLQVRGAELVELAGWMERIAEADESADAHLVRHQARHPAAERFAADREARGATEVSDRLAPGIQEDRRAVRHAAASPFPAPMHVREF